MSCNKKNIRLVAVCALFLSISFAGLAQAADDKEEKKGLDVFPWHMPEDTIFKNCYAGVGAGGMHSNSPRTNDDGSIGGNSDQDSSSFSGSAFIGYEFNDYLGVEAGYHNLGKSKFEAVSTGGPSWSAGPVSADHEAEGGSFSAVVRYPLTERLTLIGTAGMFWWISTETFVDGGVTTVEKESGQNATFSGGLEYDVGVKDRFVWRTEVHQFVVDNSSYDITQGTFSIVYKFP